MIFPLFALNLQYHFLSVALLTVNVAMFYLHVVALASHVRAAFLD